MDQKLILTLIGLCAAAGILVGGNLARREAERPIRLEMPEVTYQLVTTSEREYLKNTFEDEVVDYISGDYVITSCLEALCLDFTTGHYKDGDLVGMTLESGEEVSVERLEDWTFPDPYPIDGFNEAFERWLADNKDVIAEYLKQKDAS